MGLGLGGYVFAVFLKPIVTELGWSRTAFAGSGGPFLLAMALASPIAGAATERFGARTVFSTAITVVAAALIGLSYMTELWHFYVLGLVLGAADTGLGDIPVGAVVARWVRDGRGLALGVVYIGSNIGGTHRADRRVADRGRVVVAGRAARPRRRRLARDLSVRALGRAGWRREDAADDAGRSADGCTLAEASAHAVVLAPRGVLFLFYFYYLGVNHHLVAFLSDAGLHQRRGGAAIRLGGRGRHRRQARRRPVRRRAAGSVASRSRTFALVMLASLLLLVAGARRACCPSS